MSEINNGGLDQYGPERLEQQQFGTSGAEGVNQSQVLQKTTAAGRPTYLVPVYRLDH